MWNSSARTRARRCHTEQRSIQGMSDTQWPLRRSRPTNTEQARISWPHSSSSATAVGPPSVSTSSSPRSRVDFRRAHERGRRQLRQAQPRCAARRDRRRRDLHRAVRRREATVIERVASCDRAVRTLRSAGPEGRVRVERLPWLAGQARTPAHRRNPRHADAAPRARRRRGALRRTQRALGARLRPVAERSRPRLHGALLVAATHRRLGREPAPDAEAGRLELRHRPRAPARRSVTCAKLEERNALSLHSANDGLWDFDVETQHGLLLAALAQDARLRRARPATSSPDWRRLVHPDDLARVQALIRDHIAGKTPMFESVHRMRHTQRRVALGREPRQGARRRRGPAAPPGRRRVRHHRAQAVRGRAVQGKGKRADHAAVDRRRRHHDRRAPRRRVPEPGRRGADRLEVRGQRRAGTSTRSSAASTRKPASRSRIRCRSRSAAPARSSRCGRCC